jgi:hypothetical protein
MCFHEALKGLIGNKLDIIVVHLASGWQSVLIKPIDVRLKVAISQLERCAIEFYVAGQHSHTVEAKAT